MTEHGIQREVDQFGDGFPQGLLYHYTTIEGLLGIVKSSSLRASHVRYLNDLAEFKNAFEYTYLDVLIKSLDPQADEEGVAVLHKYMLPPVGCDSFLISFTDDEAVPPTEKVRPRPGDRLSQWRAYSNGSGGFSLGFDCSALRKEGNGFWLFRCRYSEQDKQDIAKEIGTKKNEEYKEIIKEGTKQFIGENHREPNQEDLNKIIKPAVSSLLRTLSGNYFLLAAKFKDEAFSEEREWRIVFHAIREKVLEAHRAEPDRKLVEFRPGKFGVTPYVDFPLNLKTNNPLRRIVVGPCPHMEEAVDAVKFLLAANGIQGVEVEDSKIPYRNW
jgi:hypothetical protein